MKLPILLVGASALAIAGCESIIGTGGQAGISRDTFAMCSELVKAELNNQAADTEIKDRLRDAGLMCLLAAANDVLTVTPAPATTEAQAGEVVAQDARAAAAIE